MIAYINHLTLSTGHLARTSRADVHDDGLATVAPWLQAALDSGDAVPLPMPALCHHSAKCLVQDGALVVTVYGPAGPHKPGQRHAGATMPLITLGVAQRSRQGAALWQMLVQAFGNPLGVTRPAEPWIAVTLHPTLSRYPNAAMWLGDFERCVAWAWITRNPMLQVAS